MTRISAVFYAPRVCQTRKVSRKCSPRELSGSTICPPHIQWTGKIGFWRLGRCSSLPPACSASNSRHLRRHTCLPVGWRASKTSCSCEGWSRRCRNSRRSNPWWWLGRHIYLIRLGNWIRNKSSWSQHSIIRLQAKEVTSMVNYAGLVN